MVQDLNIFSKYHSFKIRFLRFAYGESILHLKIFSEAENTTRTKFIKTLLFQDVTTYITF